MKTTSTKLSHPLLPLALILCVVIFGFSLVGQLRKKNIDTQQLTEQQVDNAIAKQDLSGIILDNINQLSALIQGILLESDQANQKLLQQQANQLLEKTDESLNVLSRGGDFHHELKLDIADSNRTTLKISYQPTEKQLYTPEVLALRPLLRTLQEDLLIAETVTAKRNQLIKAGRNVSLKESGGIEILRFRKQIEPTFRQMTEYANKLEFDARQDYLAARKSIDQTRQSNYQTANLLTTFTVGMIVLLIGFIYRQTLKNRHTLEKTVTKLQSTEADLQRSNDEMLKFNRSLEETVSQKTRELRTSEQQWRDAYDAVSSPLFLHDTEGRILKTNRAYREKAQASIEECLGRYYWEVFPIHDGPMRCCHLHPEPLQTGSEEDIYIDDAIYRSVSYQINDEEDRHIYSLHLLEDVTQNRKIHQALQASEKHFRDVTNSLNDVLIVLDRDLNIQLLNDAAVKKYAVDPDNYIGKSCHDIFFNCDDICAQCPSLHTLLTGEVVKAKRYMDDGTVLDRTIYPVFDAQGEITACTVIATDVTEAEKNLEQLQRAEQIISTSTDHLAFIDTEHRYLAVNKMFAQFFGYTPEEVVGKCASEIIGPRTYKKVAQKRYDRCLQGEAQSFQIWINYENVGLRYMDITYTPYVAESGKITGLVIRLIDITEQSEQEAKLRLSATFFESTMEGIIITDPAGNILTVNPAFTAITGYSEEEVLYKNPRMLKSERQNTDFYAELWNELKTDGRWQGELWNRRKNGEIYPQWTSMSCVTSSTGEVINYVSVFSDISTVKAAAEKLEHLAHHHPLTQLPNRLLLHARLKHSLQRAQRENSLGAVFYVDIDNFKNVNDSLGHAAGDEVLIEVAKRFQQDTREVDTVAHLSGDEFVLVMDEIRSQQDASSRAELLLKNLQKPYTIQGFEIFLSGSIGISLFPRDGDSVELLLKNADSAMYKAKEAGKNGYRIYSPDITEAALERVLLESQLRHALENNELRLFYQPQLSLPDKEIVAFEALVRWEHPEQGLMLPYKFLPLAEETGLIVPMGEWILRTACQQLVSWRQQGHPIKRIAVNLSGKQIQHKGLLQVVEKVLQETGCPAESLELEITEGFIMQHPEQSIAVLLQIRALGVELSVDDFGTGHSSLNYLKRLPINRLKIDRSFVNDIHQNPEGEAITRTIIAMGKNLNMQITAEGIETEQQCEFLIDFGCDEAQGFLFSKPLPPEQLTNLLPAAKEIPRPDNGQGDPLRKGSKLSKAAS